MDAATQSRARLTLRAIERYSQLLIDALDASLVEISAECTRWGAVSDARRWLTPSVASRADRRDLFEQIRDLSEQYAALTDEVEGLIVQGVASRQNESIAAIRDETISTTELLATSLRAWLVAAGIGVDLTTSHVLTATNGETP